MRILLCGGGTGGHIYPALALARYIKNIQKDTEILFVGSKRGLEKNLIPQEGFFLESMDVEFPSRKWHKIPRVGWNMMKSTRQVQKLLKNFSPQVVVGTGGYVSGPVMMGAWLSGYPTIVHEQNTVPGKTNRYIAPLVDRVCLSFYSSSKYFSKRAKTVVTGNPRASEMRAYSREEGAKKLGISSQQRTVLVFGGSQGAWRINQVIVDCIKKERLADGIQVLYVTGERYYQEVLEGLGNQSYPWVYLFPYLHLMSAALAASDLVVSRAGATALAELTAQGVPAILIPSPNVADNHQYFNAQVLQEKKAAITIREEDLSDETLSREINALLTSPDILNQMATSSSSLGMPEAAELMYEQLKEVSSKAFEEITPKN